MSFNSSDRGRLTPSPWEPGRKEAVGWGGEGVEGVPHLSHDSGGEFAAVRDPAVHTRLRGSLAPVDGRGIGVQELPLWLTEVETLMGLLVEARWDGDSQEGLRGEVCGDLRAVVQQGGPAAVAC